MTEADLKRDLVRQLLKEGDFARRLEDKFAIGTLDLLLVTQLYTIYAEAKLLKDIVALPATAKQRDQIKLFNDVGNMRACALVLGYRDKSIGFGLPGQHWTKHYVMPWPTINLAHHLNEAVAAIFTKELV